MRRSAPTLAGRRCPSIRAGYSPLAAKIGKDSLQLPLLLAEVYDPPVALLGWASGDPIQEDSVSPVKGADSALPSRCCPFIYY